MTPVRALLDTHALLWWIIDSPRLSEAARQVIGAESSEIYVSVASLWEARIKQRLGKLTLPANFREEITRQGFHELNVTGSDTDVLAALPLHHRDPFDRLLIAQAIGGSLTIVTADEQFAHYQVLTVG